MKKFLIIRFSSIGDIVLTTPVIRNLRKRFPDATIDFLTKPRFAELLTDNPYLDEVIVFDSGLLPMISRLRSRKYNYIIDLHHNLRSYWIKLFLRARSYSFPKMNIEKWLLVNFDVDQIPQIHIVDRYMKTLTDFEILNDNVGLDFHTSAKLDDVMLKLPEHFRKNYIVFVIGAMHFTKRLPEETVVQVCNEIDMPVILLGGTDDHDRGNLITSQSRGTIFNSCGKLALSESACLIKHAEVIVTNDTGMMHIAAAYHKKIVSVWGNTIPQFGMYPYMPDNESLNVVIQQNNLECRPCSKLGYDRCPKGHFKCMKNITPGEIVAAVQKLKELKSTSA